MLTIQYRRLQRVGIIIGLAMVVVVLWMACSSVPFGKKSPSPTYQGLPETGAGRPVGYVKPARVEAASPKSRHTKETGIFTAYTSRKSETDSHPYIMADGTTLKGTTQCVLANNKLDFGTKVKVQGLGTCLVRDRMAKDKGDNHFDVYMGIDAKRAKEFGRQKLHYHIVETPGSGEGH